MIALLCTFAPFRTPFNYREDNYFSYFLVGWDPPSHQASRLFDSGSRIYEIFLRCLEWSTVELHDWTLRQRKCQFSFH